MSQRYRLMLALPLLLPGCESAVEPSPAVPPSLALLPVIGTTTQLTKTSEYRSNVTMSGRYVVWEQSDGIHLLDLETGTESLAAAGIAQVPDISGSRLVYVRSASNHLVYRELPAGPEVVLGTSAAFPAQVDGDYVIWNVSGGVQIHRFSTGTGSVCGQCRLGILSAGRIAWSDPEAAAGSIAYVYDIELGAVIHEVVIGPRGRAGVYAMSGDRLLISSVNGVPQTHDLQIYDLSTSTWTWITNRAVDANSRLHALIGDRLIYPHADEGLVMHDLAGGASLAVVPGTPFLPFQRIETDDGIRIAWVQEFLQKDDTFIAQVFLFQSSSTQVATLHALRDTIDQCVADGAIGDPAVADHLRALVSQAEENLALGRFSAAGNNLRSFARYVEGRGRRQIEAACATALVAQAEAASAGL